MRSNSEPATESPAPISLLTVCGLEELESHRQRGVSHVLSILDPDWPEPEIFRGFDPHHRTTLRFHDEIEQRPSMILPTRQDVEAILAFGAELAAEPTPVRERHLLIHCHAGISRSTAAMTILLAQADPQASEAAVLDRVAEMRPQAWPNLRMIGFADECLNRDGRLTAALAGIYRRRLKARPELAEVLRRLHRGREVDLALKAGVASA